jgi:hypothetical protein
MGDRHCFPFLLSKNNPSRNGHDPQAVSHRPAIEPARDQWGSVRIIPGWAISFETELAARGSNECDRPYD